MLLKSQDDKYSSLVVLDSASIGAQGSDDSDDASAWLTALFH